jgi:hypothetical protein
MLTGYKVAQKVNEILQGAGLKQIPAQMVYHYINKGYIRSTEVNGQKLVSFEDAATWCEAYITKKLTKS